MFSGPDDEEAGQRRDNLTPNITAAPRSRNPPRRRVCFLPCGSRRTNFIMNVPSDPVQKAISLPARNSF
jgi:hypothetical protein